MTIELTTWNPRRGSVGDAKYEVSGGTLIDGTVDAGPQEPIDSGRADYSPIPTLPEIAAGSGLNQVNALWRRIYARLAQAAIPGQSMPGLLPFLNQGDEYRASDLLSLQAQIASMRLAYGLPTYTAFPGSAEYVQGMPIKGAHLAHLRKALALDGPAVVSVPVYYFWNYANGSDSVLTTILRSDYPYNTPYAVDFLNKTWARRGRASWFVPGRIGKLIDPFVLYQDPSDEAQISRYRKISNVLIPPYDDFSAVALQMTVENKTIDMEDLQVKVYLSNMVASVPPNLLPWGHGQPDQLDVLLATASVDNGVVSIPLNANALKAAGLGWKTFIIGTAHELAGTGSHSRSGGKGSYVDIVEGSAKLVFTF
jgi:hypothetical protein